MSNRSDEAKKYRSKKRLEMGEIAFKEEQARKRRERRAKAKNQSVDTVSVATKIELSNRCDDLLEQLYQSKLKHLKTIGKKPVKRQTMIQQFNKVKNIYKFMFDKEMDCIDFDFLKDTIKIIKFVNDHWNTPESRNGQIQAISSILQSLDKYEKEYKFYSNYSIVGRKAITDSNKENKLTDREKENYVEWNDIKKMVSNVKDMRDRALIGLYIGLPPRRASAVGIIRFGDRKMSKNTEYNWYVGGAIIYNKYKTSDAYGVVEIPIPIGLKKLWDKYIRETGLKHGDLLFGTKKGTPYKNFGKILTDTFKPYTKTNITTNMLRHSFISELLKKNRSIKEREKIALWMGHSLTTQDFYNRII